MKARKRVGLRRGLLIALAVIGLLAGAGGLYGASGGTRNATVAASHRGAAFASRRYRYSGILPSGWRRAPRRLVPRLLDPREILSVGTFAMPVGGGGDCGREPVAAIERMRTGDALITIQETAEAANRRRLRRSRPLPHMRQALSDLRLRPMLHAPSERVPASRKLWYSQLDFSAAGREFGTLIYVRGTPSPARLGQVKAILEGMRFAPIGG